MHFSEIIVKNLFSFKDAKFRFDKYNVIVGTNNSGKTNLLRIIKKLTESGHLAGFTISRSIKFKPNEKSRLTLNIVLTDEELRFLLQSIFQIHFLLSSVPDSLKSIQIVINWNDLISDVPVPTSIFIIFKNGLTIMTNYDRLLVFYSNILKKEIDRDVFFTKLFEENFDMFSKIFTEHNISIVPNFPLRTEFFQDFIDENSLELHFKKDDHYIIPSLDASILYEYQNPSKFSAEIFDFVGKQRTANSQIHFIEVLSHILKNNFVSISEIQPSYSQLIADLFNLKVTNEDAYKILQEVFSDLFDNTTVKVEQGRNNETKHIIISESNRDFEISESASGYYAAIHILHSILNQPNRVLLLDEPEVHFHPVKIRQLGQKFMELSEKSNNQIILLTHSPKFVDFRLLDPGYPYTLTNLTRENGASTPTLTPSRFDVNLSPHLFNPEMFFGKCSLLVEGADDEFVMRAISDKFDGILDKHGITIINCWGVPNIFPNILLHKAFNIPWLALVDKEYDNDLQNVVRLKEDLETELQKIGCTVTKNQLKPAIGYCFIKDCLETKEGLKKLKTTDIWKAFIEVLNKSTSEIPNFEKFY